MTTRKQVLDMLLKGEGEYISGSMIAESLSISRTAVNKAIKRLKQEGYSIEAKKHYGYSLDAEYDVLNEESLNEDLKGSGIRGFHFEETVSTNKDAKRMAGEGVSTPFLVAASRQSGGRGRLGRSFVSPPGGVYFSLVLSGRDIASPSLVTVSAAWAVAETLDRLCGIETSIKWVNDVFLGGRKIVGILTEGIVNMEEGGLSQIVIGCGINLKTKKEEFPSSLEDTVTSIYPDGKTKLSRSYVAAECAKAIIRVQKEDFLDGYRKKCFVIGKRIYVVKLGEKKEAEALRIDDGGHLVVRYGDGSVEALSSGEVSIRL